MRRRRGGDDESPPREASEKKPETVDSVGTPGNIALVADE
jgi:hypothetical protein